MAFYLKPPLGVLPLHTLQICVRERFHYLQDLLKDDGVTHVPKNFDYLIEGTAMDRAGHFLLRLISLSSPQFQEFVSAAETKFFLLRLKSCNSIQEIRAFLKLLHRHAGECISSQPKLLKNYHQFLTSAKYVCERMMIKSVAAHSFHGNHHHSCSEFSITLPFTMCLPMVRERKVELRAGYAAIPCGKWKQLLAMFFQEHIQLGMAQLHDTGCFERALQDPRMKELIWELGSQFKFDKRMKFERQLKASDIKTESKFFPLCMAHLYQNLQVKHRLTHEARRHFTLFLKDAGMPLEESINYWREEYSHPHTCSSCNHSWQKDSKRYIYSIRHMYGLEGGRYNYNVPNCRKIQAMSLNTVADGGCPFTHFDDKQLLSCFPDRLKSNDVKCKKVLQLKAEQKPQEACQVYLTACKQTTQEVKLPHSSDKAEHIGEKISFRISNPIQYYLSYKLEHGKPKVF